MKSFTQGVKFCVGLVVALAADLVISVTHRKVTYVATPIPFAARRSAPSGAGTGPLADPRDDVLRRSLHDIAERHYGVPNPDRPAFWGGTFPDELEDLQERFKRSPEIF